MAEAPFCLLHVKEAWRRLIHILHPPQKQISPQNYFHFIVFSVSMIKILLKSYFLPVAFPMRAECSSASLRTLSIIDSELIVAPLTASISVVGISFNAAPFQLFRKPLPRNARQPPPEYLHFCRSEHRQPFRHGQQQPLRSPPHIRSSFPPPAQKIKQSQFISIAILDPVNLTPELFQC